MGWSQIDLRSHGAPRRAGETKEERALIDAAVRDGKVTYCPTGHAWGATSMVRIDITVALSGTLSGGRSRGVRG